MNPIFRAIIQKGKVVFDQVDLFNSYLTGLEGKEIEVIVRRKKKSRSLPQNAYYWGVCIKLLCETTGYIESGDDEKMHIALKMMFLQDKTRKILTLRSTTELSTTEMETYLESVRHWALTELNCFIPLPNEIDLGTPDPEPEHLKPTLKNIKAHQVQVAKDAEARKTQLVDSKTLEELFGWIGKGSITEEKIMQLCRDNFNGKEPRELTQDEAESLDTIIIIEGVK